MAAPHPQTFSRPHVKKLWVFLSPPNKTREAKIAYFLLKKVQKILADDSLDFGEQLRQVYEYLSVQKNKASSDHNFRQMGIDAEILGHIGPNGGPSAHHFKI